MEDDDDILRAGCYDNLLSVHLLGMPPVGMWAKLNTSPVAPPMGLAFLLLQCTMNKQNIELLSLAQHDLLA